MSTQYTVLFSEQGTDAVSEPFRSDDSLAANMKPALRTWGTLDGGNATLQTLNPLKTLANADMAANSDDWQDTDDVIPEQAYTPMERSRLYHRIKLVGLGETASFNAEIIKNYV